MTDKLTVSRAAIMTADGIVWSVPRPGRHHDVIRLISEASAYMAKDTLQGFVLSDGSFVSRIRAADVAKEAGQLLPRAPTAGHWGHGLFSEDVW